MSEDLVYIVLVNYNGYKDTVECIKSLRNITYSNYKIVLVENASKDVEAIKNDKYINDNAIVLYSEENGGFSAGNNIGIEYAMKNGAEYVLLLNNDTTVDKEFLNKMIECSKQDSNIGIVTGDIFYYYENNKLWYSNGDYNLKNGFTEMYRQTVLEQNEVSFACGCLMLLKRSMIEELGVLDDRFFLYSEDTEYCCRAIKAGWRIVWTQSAKIFHKISASTGENSNFQQYYLTRNNLILTQMYGSKKLRGYVSRLWYCLKDIIKGRCHISPVFWGYVDFIKGRSGKTNRY